jgi:Mor family transcriptional regulator
MTINEAQEKLVNLKQVALNIRREIGQVQAYLREKGVDPEIPSDRRENFERNKEIYKSYQEGLKYSEIAMTFKITSNRVTKICRRIDSVLDGKGRKSPAQYEIYKELEKYRK